MSELVESIYENYKEKRTNEHRPHLGGSQIGNACSRALWYQFRHAWTPFFPGQILRLFETGHLEEDRIVSNLRDIGIEVWDVDTSTGKQIKFEAYGGHFSLSLDGVGRGFKESSDAHTLEFKTMNDRNFKDLKKNGVQKSKPVYWSQCQVGMFLSELDWCYFIAVNKNTDELYAERISLNKEEAISLMNKARDIIFSALPPTRLSDDPSDWRCKFCHYWAICHGCKIPEVNCRTCAHVTPERDGSWSCTRRSVCSPCEEHLFIPMIMPKYLKMVDCAGDWVDYENSDTGEIFRNSENSIDIFNGSFS